LFALIAVCFPHQALLISLKARELWLAIASYPMQLQQKRTVLQHVFHLLLSSAFFPFPTLPTVGPTKKKIKKKKKKKAAPINCQSNFFLSDNLQARVSGRRSLKMDPNLRL
jgi:hypothetical protein